MTPEPRQVVRHSDLLNTEAHTRVWIAGLCAGPGFLLESHLQNTGLPQNVPRLQTKHISLVYTESSNAVTVTSLCRKGVLVSPKAIETTPRQRSLPPAVPWDGDVPFPGCTADRWQDHETKISEKMEDRGGQC